MYARQPRCQSLGARALSSIRTFEYLFTGYLKQRILRRQGIYNTEGHQLGGQRKPGLFFAGAAKERLRLGLRSENRRKPSWFRTENMHRDQLYDGARTEFDVYRHWPKRALRSLLLLPGP